MTKEDANSALSLKEIGLRVAAARKMRGHSKRPEFAKMVATKHDLNWSALGRIERGEAVLKKGWRDALVEELKVPENWFTGELVGETPEPSLAARLASIDQQLEELPNRIAGAVDRLLQEQGRDSLANDEGSGSTQNDEDDPPDVQELP